MVEENQGFAYEMSEDSATIEINNQQVAIDDMLQEAQKVVLEGQASVEKGQQLIYYGHDILQQASDLRDEIAAQVQALLEGDTSLVGLADHGDTRDDAVSNSLSNGILALLNPSVSIRTSPIMTKFNKYHRAALNMKIGAPSPIHPLLPASTTSLALEPPALLPSKASLSTKRLIGIIMDAVLLVLTELLSKKTRTLSVKSSPLDRTVTLDLLIMPPSSEARLLTIPSLRLLMSRWLIPRCSRPHPLR